MKSVSRFLLLALALIPGATVASPVATTAGSNLTAYNPGFGSVNNNNWNSLTNPRSNGDVTAPAAPTADFGNCNALIMRCAQPKCSGGGCTDMDVASGIVSGCVSANPTCKKHGDDLVKYIAAQLVATSAARANSAAAASQSQQNNEQMSAVQQQMAQTQHLLAQQTQALNALQSELNEQKQATAQAIADAANAVATAAPTQNTTPVTPTEGTGTLNVDTDGLSATQRVAAEAGIDPDLLRREQISGQILSQIENAVQSLDNLRASMDDAFKYAGCDTRGSNCSGPKRVAVFKEKANKFFDPYEDVLDQLYEALYLAQSVGVDISNIYQYLNNSCQAWAKYMCSKPLYASENPVDKGKYLYVWPRYQNNNCSADGKSIAGAPIFDYNYQIIGSVRGNHDCSVGQTIPPEDDTSCTMLEVMKNSSDSDSNGIETKYLYPDDGDMGNMVRVGCASSMLENSWLFRNKKQKAKIDIETLRRIIEQDAHPVAVRDDFVNRSRTGIGPAEQLKFCAITETEYANLQRYVTLRGLPTKNICLNDRKITNRLGDSFIGMSDALREIAQKNCDAVAGGGAAFSEDLIRCFCKDKAGNRATSNCDPNESKDYMHEEEEKKCKDLGGTYNTTDYKCDCSTSTYPESKLECAYQFPMNNSGIIGTTPYAPVSNIIDPREYKCTGAGGTFQDGQCWCGPSQSGGSTTTFETTENKCVCTTTISGGTKNKTCDLKPQKPTP